MTLEDSIIIFANTYSCPLDRRCEGCVFEEMSKIDKKEMYELIVKMEYTDKRSLIEECLSCQEENEAVKSQ